MALRRHHGDHLTWSVYFALQDGEVNADNVNFHIGTLEIAVEVYKASGHHLIAEAVEGNTCAIASLRAGNYAQALVDLYHL